MVPVKSTGAQVEQAGVGLYFKMDNFGRSAGVVQASFTVCAKQDSRQNNLAYDFKLILRRYYVEMVLSNSSAEATGVVAKGDILEVVDEKHTQV